VASDNCGDYHNLVDGQSAVLVLSHMKNLRVFGRAHDRRQRGQVVEPESEWVRQAPGAVRALLRQLRGPRVSPSGETLCPPSPSPDPLPCNASNDPRVTLVKGPCEGSTQCRLEPFLSPPPPPCGPDCFLSLQAPRADAPHHAPLHRHHGGRDQNRQPRRQPQHGQHPPGVHHGGSAELQPQRR